MADLRQEIESLLSFDGMSTVGTLFCSCFDLFSYFSPLYEKCVSLKCLVDTLNLSFQGRMVYMYMQCVCASVGYIFLMKAIYNVYSW